VEPDESNTRYRPTKELYKAENQLIYYWYQARGDSGFRERFGLTSEGQVKLGGVIMGRNDTITKDQDATKVKAARYSLAIRTNTLYQHHGMKVLVWDRIISFLGEPASPSSTPASTRS
jgi:hypothetical protein